MNQSQSPTLTDMISRLNAFQDGSFGIDRRDGTAPLVLCANRQILPIETFRLALWDQDGTAICNFREFPSGLSLIFDEAGNAPATCRLALIDKGKQSLLALADDESPISGHLFVSIRPQVSDAQLWAVSALFDRTQGCQVSSVLWHDDPELVRFLFLQAALFERGYPSNAQQLQSETFFNDFEPFS